jgi:hypothetical protein
MKLTDIVTGARDILHQQPTCPYCHQPLERPPKRAMPCPHCKQKIHVRQGKAYTAAQITAMQEQARIDGFVSMLSQFGVTRKAFDRQRELLSARFKSPASTADTVWGVLNSLVSASRTHKELEVIYLRMAQFRQAEGGEYKDLIAEALRHKAAQLKEEVSGFKKLPVDGKVVIRTCNDENVCPGCASAAQSSYTVAQFLASMPIPTACTAEMGCRCWVGWTMRE